jgi:flagellar motor switch protein FliN/FliY
LVLQILAGVKKLSNEIPPPASRGTKAYLSVWMAGACEVLETITGTPFTAIDLTPEEVAGQVESLRKKGVWLRFTVANALKGEQSFGIGKSDALRLAQILLGEPFDETPDFSAEYQDALAELFRQFAGAAALALKPRAGGEVSLQFAGHGAAKWKPNVREGVRLKSEGTAEFLLVILLDPVLGESLASSSLGEPAQPSGPSNRSAPPPSTAASRPSTSATKEPSSTPAPKDTRRVDLLLDVELQVSLRFGKREMLLGDILELSAGAVVELDQKILEPVELLVGNKVVAHGEVVVTDGHYALRVTEVLNPMERLESLRE